MEAENQRSEEENQSTTVTENENRCRYADNNYLSSLRARSEEKKNEDVLRGGRIGDRFVNIYLF